MLNHRWKKCIDLKKDYPKKKLLWGHGLQLRHSRPTSFSATPRKEA